MSLFSLTCSSREYLRSCLHPEWLASIQNVESKRKGAKGSNLPSGVGCCAGSVVPVDCQSKVLTRP